MNRYNYNNINKGNINKTEKLCNHNRATVVAINRRRANNKPVIILFLTFVISFLLVLGMQFVDVNAKKTPTTMLKREYISIEIRPGDTLSSIASKYMGVGYSNLSDYINDIKKVNSIKENTIYSGQSLIIPTYTIMEE